VRILSLKTNDKITHPNDMRVINTGSDKNPHWSTIKSNPKNLEIIRIPKQVSKNMHIQKNSFNKTMSFFKIQDNKNNFINTRHASTHKLSPFKTNNLQQIEDIYVINLLITYLLI